MRDNSQIAFRKSKIIKHNLETHMREFLWCLTSPETAQGEHPTCKARTQCTPSTAAAHVRGNTQPCWRVLETTPHMAINAATHTTASSCHSRMHHTQMTLAMQLTGSQTDSSPCPSSAESAVHLCFLSNLLEYVKGEYHEADQTAAPLTPRLSCCSPRKKAKVPHRS